MESWKKDLERIKRLASKGSVRGLSKFLSSEHNIVRSRAVEALRDTGNIRSIDPLIDTLCDPDVFVSSAAKRALQKIGTPAISPLISALLRDEGKKVTSARIAALTDLLYLKPQEGISLLVKAFPKGSYRERCLLLRALSQNNTDLFVEKIKAADHNKIPVVEMLRTCLDCDNEGLRMTAAYALGLWGDTQIVPRLVPLLLDKSRSMRRTVVQSLSLLGWTPKDEIERAAHLIATEQVTDLAQLDCEIVHGILMQSLDTDIDWEAKAYISRILIKWGMDNKDPRLLPLIDQLIVAAVTPDIWSAELIPGDQVDHWGVTESTCLESKRATARQHLMDIGLKDVAEVAQAVTDQADWHSYALECLDIRGPHVSHYSYWRWVQAKLRREVYMNKRALKTIHEIGIPRV